MTTHPPIIGIYTGHETTEELRKIADDIGAAAWRHTEGDDAAKHEATAQSVLRHMRESIAAKLHVALANLDAEYQETLRNAQDYLSDAGAAWESLNSATNWRATHHRMVVETHGAVRNLRRLIQIARQMNTCADTIPGGLARYDQYAEIAGEEAVPLPSVEARRQELDAFVETSRERFTLARSTISGMMPEFLSLIPEEDQGERFTD